MKKLISLFLVLTLVFSLVPAVHAETYSGSAGIGINWTLDTATGVLNIRGNGNMKDFGSFDAPWQDYNKNITSVVIEPGVTSIGNNAFLNCFYLTSISIPEGVTRIGAAAFRWCERLETIQLPQSLTSIGAEAFLKCLKLKSVVIPANVTVIGDSAFQSCDVLTSVKMYEGIETVGIRAFCWCPKLEHAMLPNSVTSVGEYAFSGCSKLVAQRFGDNITLIPWCAMDGCKALTSLYIGKNVQQIDYAAFQGCTSLKHTVLPEGLLKIGESAFRESGLVEITIPSTTTFVTGGAFMNCKNLKRIAVLNPDCLTQTSHSYGDETYGVVGVTTIYGHESYTTKNSHATALQFADAFGYGFEFINEENLWRDYVEPAPNGEYAGGTEENPFTDVWNPNEYYYDPVLWAYENQITAGVTATTFDPNGFCKRGQVVTFLWRAMEKPESGLSSCPFLDVSKLEYYYPAILWACENQITMGVDATHFAPDATVTRGQFVTFLWRTAGSPSASKNTGFTDVPATEYYAEAVAWAVENGITQGTGSGKFSPNDTCTRAQVVTFLYRLLG